MSEIDLEAIINHEEALELAHLNKGGSNLSRCYIALWDEVESLRARVKEQEETLEHGCLRCGYVGPIPEPTKGDTHEH